MSLDINNLKNIVHLPTKLEAPANPNDAFTVHPKELNLFDVAGIKFVDDGSVSYKYNIDGFRSDNFKISSRDTILFAGCSEGEGIGGNIDDIWNKIIYDNINKDKPLDGFLNLSCDNFGYHKIINNCITYINKYGTPGSIVILFPDMSRSIIWDSELQRYGQDWINTKRGMSKEQIDRLQQHLINFISYISLFEEYCYSNNIKLYWSTISDYDLEIFKELDIFKSFVPMDYNKYPVVSDFEKRDGHHGNGYHLSWANNFLDWIKHA